ncbi:MAG: S-layer homology domain-containing protein [Clostridiales bacterium]|nr:S-layer homology domain-containing protein [Clostridiales bacterium]
MNMVRLSKVKTFATAFIAVFGICAGFGIPALASGNIEINETNFPDFNFRYWLQRHDFGEDKVLTPDEILDIKEISIKQDFIRNLKGIEFFTELEQLTLSYCRLENLDVSRNTKLKNLDFSNNSISDIDLSKNTKLVELICNNNKLTNLDLTNNPDLENVVDNDNPDLKMVFFSKIPPSHTKDPGVLEIIPKEGEIQITSSTFPDENFRNYILTQEYASDWILDEEEIASVKELDVNFMQIVNLKGIEYFTALTSLDCSANRLNGHLDLSKNTELVLLDCRGQQDPKARLSVDVLSCTKLKRLYGSYSDIISLDVSNCTELEELYVSDNNLTSLDVSNNPELTALGIGGNNLSSLDVSNNKKLTELHCQDSGLSSIDLSNNLLLEELQISQNNLTSLDVSKNVKLWSLYCDRNQITEIDLTKNPDLKAFCVDCNNLKTLDLTKNPKALMLFCKDNPDLRAIYLCDKPSAFLYFERDEGVATFVLTKEDWKYAGIEWDLDEEDISKTKAQAKFQCTKEGATDYVVLAPMEIVNRAYTKASCEEKGSATFDVTLAEEDSRTEEAISDTVTVEIPAKGHKWSGWNVTKAATLTSQGEESRTCSVCGRSESRKTAMLTPTPTPKPKAKPTATVKPTATPTKSAKPTAATRVSLTLDKKKVSIVCGNTDKIKATLKGADSKISWKSSDKKIATVDKEGNITAKRAGQVTITATAAGKSAKCTVTVLYKDVTNSKVFWFAPTNYLTAKGVVKGYDNQTKFKPANECTRAQMVTFIWRLQGEPKPKATACKFKDVKKTDYFYNACIWGNENHIVEGYKDGTFGPQIVCARKHAVTFLWRLAGQPKPSSTKNKFKDVKEKDYFYKATLWASEKKILAGYSDGTFRPDGKCLRRQMVTFLYKYDKFVNNKG